MAKSSHVHKFKRLRYKSGNEIFFCTLPDCNQKINTSLVLGKRSICWRCNNEFIMNEYSLRLTKPHCTACHQPKNPKKIVDIPIKGFDDEVKLGPPEQPIELTLAQRLAKLTHSEDLIEEEEL